MKSAAPSSVISPKGEWLSTHPQPQLWLYAAIENATFEKLRGPCGNLHDRNDEPVLWRSERLPVTRNNRRNMRPDTRRRADSMELFGPSRIYLQV
jgi:hypothetical protein